MILTLTGASGAGKTTIARELLKKLPTDAQMVPSYTTRKPRDNDVLGEYKHVSNIEFQFLKKMGVFLWTVCPHDKDYYGTTKRWARRALRDSNTAYIMILTPDAVGKLRNFSEQAGYTDEIFSFYVISPPENILRERLRSRGDSESEIEKRLADCVEWDSEAMASGIPYEFIKNEGTAEETTKEMVNRFLIRFGDCWF